MAVLLRLTLVLLLGLASTPLAAVPAWRVSAPEAPGEVLLLGSVHLLRQSHLPLPAIVERSYAAADRLVMELHPADLEPAATAAALAQVGIDSPGLRTRELLGRDGLRELETHARSAGLEPEALARLEPWFVAITLYTGALAAAGYDPALGLDQQLGDRALRDGLPVGGLETIEQQLGIFKTLAPGTQRDLLHKTLEQLDEAAAETDLLVAAWLDSDLAALGLSLEDDFRGYPALRARLVEDRNDAWAPEVAALLQQEGTALVVVGALHMVGPGGLPELLRARGLSVDPLH